MTDEDKKRIEQLAEDVETAVAAAREVRDLYARYIGLTDEFDYISGESIERAYATLVERAGSSK